MPLISMYTYIHNSSLSLANLHLRRSFLVLGG